MAHFKVSHIRYKELVKKLKFNESIDKGIGVCGIGRDVGGVRYWCFAYLYK